MPLLIKGAVVTDVLDIARSQEGVSEVNGTSKYGKWLDQQVGMHLYYNLDWCGAFQLWCIAQGGQMWLDAAGGLHREYAEVQVWFDWMQMHGRVSKVPKPRRLVWYDWYGTPDGANHIGMVASVDAGGRSFKAWEGNHNNKVELVTRLFDSQVMGFGEWWSFIKQPTPSSAADFDHWIAP
jgi:hypothetical protein